MQRFAKVPVHAATILKCAESAIILERIRELTVGEYGRGQFCQATAKWWSFSTPWISIRRVQEIIKRLVDEGYAIRVQNYEAGTGRKSSSLYAMTAKGLEILAINELSDLVNPEAIEVNDKEIASYLEANAGSRAGGLTQDSAHTSAGFRASGAQDSAHLLDSSSNRQYEVNSNMGVSAEATKQQPEKAAIVSSSLSTQTPALTSQSAAPALRSELTTPPKPARKQKAAAGPKIPTLEEFVAWAGVSHPGWEREAEAWHKRMASQDWITSTGKLVLNAKGTFNTWIANGWINKLTPQQELPRFGSFGHRE